MTSRPPLLQDVRILDLSTVIAAPFAATLCADLGATVTKIELPDGSDALRGLAPTTPEYALYWKAVNRGKTGITLDVRTAKGKELFLKILKNTDVLVENFRTGTMDRWGLDLKTLLEANPKLLVLRLTGFGQTGPYAARPGFARIFEAMSGLTNLIGTPASGPQHPNLPIGDLVAGLFGALSISAAIASIRRDPSQSGFEIDLSATEAVFRLLDPLAVEYEVLGVNRTHEGNRASYTAPSNMYQTKDGLWVTLVASSDAIFKRLCTAIGKSEWVDDPRFSSNPNRCINVVELDTGIANWFAHNRYLEIEKLLNEAGIPYTKVYDIKDVLDDPQVKARNGIIRLVDTDLGSIPAPCVVPRVSDIKMATIKSGPKTGEDNSTFYKTLGLSDQEINTLEKDGII
ncbi:Formyl-CoA transferase [beta proteobacterium CB]|jgi:crotonobetainyl-CoA:carnitine CoA-transferase CaiB-like acyl-CoA transferase|nr:Formyl-CoA transferase [beta proteobacterium CB]